MMEREIREDEAGVIYGLLVALAGAYDDDGARYSFIRSVCKDDHPCREYRFQGNLGFGGKFRNNGNNGGVPYIDCYPEDETPARRAIIDDVNEKFRQIFSSDLSAPKEGL